jgi:hypothetical protein
MSNPHIIIHLTPQRHRKLKKAAKRSGVSLSQYVSAIIPWESLPEVSIDKPQEANRENINPSTNTEPRGAGSD